MKRFSLVVLSFLFVAATLVSIPVYADNALDFLKTTVMAALDRIQSTLFAVQTAVANVRSSVNGVQTTLNDVNTKAGRTSRFVIFSRSVVTHENASTPISAGEVPGLPYNTIARFTVSVQPWGLVGAPPGIDRVSLFCGVVDDTTGTPVDITIADIDPAGSTGVHAGPYVGANTFVSVRRGADGLGDVRVLVNSTIELPNS